MYVRKYPKLIQSKRGKRGNRPLYVRGFPQVALNILCLRRPCLEPQSLLNHSDCIMIYVLWMIILLTLRGHYRPSPSSLGTLPLLPGTLAVPTTEILITTDSFADLISTTK